MISGSPGLCSNVGCDVTVCSLEKQGVAGETREGEAGGECHQSSAPPISQVDINYKQKCRKEWKFPQKAGIWRKIPGIPSQLIFLSKGERVAWQSIPMLAEIIIFISDINCSVQSVASGCFLQYINVRYDEILWIMQRTLNTQHYTNILTRMNGLSS